MKIEPLIYLQLAFRFGYFVFKVKTRKWCANNKKKMMKNEANFFRRSPFVSPRIIVINCTLLLFAFEANIPGSA